ncbi:FMN-binding negative transcriptional regulator [Bradyrhizobium sp. URHD0069]|uniref:FMN-binding negative transcriptional regulator n=1 Tax=Bradyrhizobium sp. URHD0069 TaxID=1380355 RepID=UPI00049625FE|nr:FMN-binding negative transcriptional regulator [Bradyrhizobium sp. URHD0069]
MFTRPFFEPDRTASLAFVAARGFGVVCAHDGGKPVASSLPFCLEYSSDGTPCVSFHVARGNPLAALAGDKSSGSSSKSSWLLAVNGADAYVSPHWYASPDQVPTWLYQAVHLSGPVRTMTGQQLADHLDALSAKFESWLAPEPPWTTSELTTGRREAMMQAIVGLVMTVEEIEGSFKLNQHKSDVDHVAVATALARQPDAAAQAVASEMRALRPQLFAAQTTQLNAMAIPEGTM